MRFLVIDGQGGRLGKLLIEGIRKDFPQAEILAVGTNAVATATMLKAGADEAATGENPVLVASRTVDVIAGPIGIVIAVGQSSAVKVLVPMNRCDNLVAGVSMLTIGELVEDAVARIKEAACNL